MNEQFLFSLSLVSQWLLDHDINVDNCSYSSQTGKFCFGGKGKRLTPEEAEKIDHKLKSLGFPFEYELRVG